MHMPSAGGPPITEFGDLWVLGEHRITCGDARDRPPTPQTLAPIKNRLDEMLRCIGLITR
jgi:hypothetical protein